MDYRNRLSPLGNSSTGSGSSDPYLARATVRPSGHHFFLSAVHICTLILSPSSSISMSYFILAVPLCKCLGNHSCMSSTFPVAILNGTCSLLLVKAVI